MKPLPPKYTSREEILKIPTWQRKRHFKKLKKYKKAIANINKKERKKQEKNKK